MIKGYWIWVTDIFGRETSIWEGDLDAAVNRVKELMSDAKSLRIVTEYNTDPIISYTPTKRRSRNPPSNRPRRSRKEPP